MPIGLRGSTKSREEPQAEIKRKPFQRRHPLLLGDDGDSLRSVQLNGRGAHVIATDPEAIPNSIRLQPQLGFATDTADALHGADCVVLVTEWQEYRDLDPVALKQQVRTPLIIDGRNVLDPEQWRAAGWTSIGTGRP